MRPDAQPEPEEEDEEVVMNTAEEGEAGGEEGEAGGEEGEAALVADDGGGDEGELEPPVSAEAPAAV